MPQDHHDISSLPRYNLGCHADPELAHEVLVSKFRSFHDRPNISASLVTTYARRGIVRAGILWAQGASWASLRAAVQPVFHSTSLMQYGPVMQQASQRVLDNIRSRPPDTPFDIRELLSAAALDIIFKCAYGIDLHQNVRRSWSTCVQLPCRPDHFSHCSDSCHR
jgi:cytochrome P450